MNVSIVTVYNSTNCGSFLQAYGLKYVLEKNGCNVTFLKTGVKNNKKIFLKKALSNIKKRRFSKIGFDYKVYRNFESAIKRFSLLDFKPQMVSNQDLFVLGSDEIWNASRKVIKDSEVFFGKGLDGRIISFAPSVNVATVDDMLKIAAIKDYINKLDKISVRDSHSKEVIGKLTDKDIKIVCDPTFLLPMEEYDRLEGKRDIDNFIMVYSAGGRFDSERKKDIKDFAKACNKKLVAFPHKLDWCDYQFPADPFDAIAFFKKADFVITDTFHGAALSLIFNKNFVAIPQENRKVTELLEYFGLENLIVDETKGLCEFFSKEQYSKEKLNERIYAERKKAEDYLVSALNN